MANGNGNGLSDGFWRDMPWWIKAIALVGVPSLISLTVVLSDRVQLVATVQESHEILQTMQRQRNEDVARMMLRTDELNGAVAETNRLLLAQCVNEAYKSPTVDAAATARDRCFGSTREGR